MLNLSRHGPRIHVCSLEPLERALAPFCALHIAVPTQRGMADDVVDSQRGALRSPVLCTLPAPLFRYACLVGEKGTGHPGRRRR